MRFKLKWPGRPHRKLIGYALGGGGARGLSHIGVLKVLEKQGIHPDIIVGTSIGSIIGALYATGHEAADIENMVLSHDRVRLPALLDLAAPVRAIIQGRRVASLLEAAVGATTFQDARIRFACVATDLVTGQEVIFDRGSILAAVRASMAVPGVFPPVEYEGKLLVDGGIVDAVPVHVCRDMGAGYVVGINVVPDPTRKVQRGDRKGKHVAGAVHVEGRPVPRMRLAEVMTQTVLIFEHHIAQENMAGADLRVQPAVEGIGFWQFDRAAEAIALGEEAARRALTGDVRWQSLIERTRSTRNRS